MKYWKKSLLLLASCYGELLYRCIGNEYQHTLWLRKYQRIAKLKWMMMIWYLYKLLGHLKNNMWGFYFWLFSIHIHLCFSHLIICFFLYYMYIFTFDINFLQMLETYQETRCKIHINLFFRILSEQIIFVYIEMIVYQST